MTDSIYRLRHRDILCFCVLALLCLGVLMVHSATMRAVGDGHWHWSADGTKQLIFAAMAMGVFLLVGRMDYRELNRPATAWFGHPISWAVLAATLCCVLVLVPHVGVQINGARRWLKIGPIQIQPSELAKWAVVLFLAYVLANRPVDMDRFFRGLLRTATGRIALPDGRNPGFRNRRPDRPVRPDNARRRPRKTLASRNRRPPRRSGRTLVRPP
jgi:cell division protein FtsW (lipid II flippase)